MVLHTDKAQFPFDCSLLGRPFPSCLSPWHRCGVPQCFHWISRHPCWLAAFGILRSNTVKTTHSCEASWIETAAQSRWNRSHLALRRDQQNLPRCHSPFTVGLPICRWTPYYFIRKESDKMVWFATLPQWKGIYLTLCKTLKNSFGLIVLRGLLKSPTITWAWSLTETQKEFNVATAEGADSGGSVVCF